MADNIVLSLGTQDGKTIATDEISVRHFQMVKLALGADGVNNGTIGKTLAMPISDGLSIARGMVTGLSHINKFGRNPDIDTAASEDIWDGGGLWVPPTTARLHNIASTSAADDGAPPGTGAWTVTIEGLDAAGLPQSETVTMNGVSNVATANTYIMIHRMYVVTAGSGGANAGIITATAQTDATITAQINAGNNQTLMAIYRVPSNATGYLHHFAYGGAANTTATLSATIFVKSNAANSVWQPKHISAASGAHVHEIEPPLVVPADSTLRIHCATDTNNTDAFADFDMVLET